MVTAEQYQEISDLWGENAHSLGFAVSDGLSYEAFGAGYVIAKGWL